MRRGEEGKEEWGEETGGGIQSFLLSKQTVIEVQFSFPNPVALTLISRRARAGSLNIVNEVYQYCPLINQPWLMGESGACGYI